MAQLTKEDLENMSPEEILELQKQNCIFCKIIKGEQESKKLYENDKLLVVLDIFPANPGHVLIIPKEHYSIMPQMPDELISELFYMSKIASNAMLGALGVEGTNIFVANGGVAGQKAPHFMIHVIPRYPNDGLNMFNLKRKNPEEFGDVISTLQAKIKELTGAAPQATEKSQQQTSSEKASESNKKPAEENKKPEAGEESSKKDELESLVGNDEESDEKAKKKSDEADLDKISELFG